MKKSGKILSVCGVVLAAGAICGSVLYINQKDAVKTSTSSVEVLTEAPTEAETPQGTIDDLAQYLLDQGVVAGSTEEPLYTYIGAINGFKYLDSDVEVYEYDMTSDTYQEIVNTNSVSGLTVSAINGPYVLIFSNGNVDQAVIDSFNAFK